MHKVIPTWRKTVDEYIRRNGDVNFICDECHTQTQTLAVNAVVEWNLPRDKNGR